MKKIILTTGVFVCCLTSFSFAQLLSSTSCGGASGQTFSSWADANAGRTNLGSCSGGDGYLQPGSNIITDNGHGGTSSWNCTGWNGSIYVVTASCSLTVNIPPATTGATTTTTTTTPPPVSTCSEGQYFCSTEDICKPAGQPCNTLCAVGSTVKWVDFSNLYTALGNSGTVQMSGQNVFVNYFGQLNMFGITGESQWNIVNGNPVMFPNGVADNIPDQSDIIWTTGGGTTLHRVTFSQPVKNPVMVIYSIGWNRVEYQFNQPFTILKKTADVNKLASNAIE